MARRKQEPSRVDELLDELLGENPSPEDILGESGLMKQLSKRLIERALVGELNHQLQSQTITVNQPEEDLGRPNSRNGYSKKTVQSDQGVMDLAIPRDRRGEFEPILVPKHQRRLAGLDEKIVSLYARGMGTREISDQLKELYGGVEISASLISEVTDAVLDEVKAWQSRPLDEVYPVVYLDALYVNIKVSGRVSKRAVYVVLGITRDGDKQLLGLWLGEVETEGAKFWLKVLTDLKNRGLQDILIACCDGLKGFPQAIEAVYPKTQVQVCIVHLIRNSLRHVPWQEAKAVASDLKPIYQAATLNDAETALEAFIAKWDATYPAVSQIWLRHWEHIIPIFDYPMAIRKVIYTTNAIESLNRSLRKVIKTKAVFPDESSILKLMYLAMHNIAKRWNRPLKDWKAAASHFAIMFPDRFIY